MTRWCRRPLLAGMMAACTMAACAGGQTPRTGTTPPETRGGYPHTAADVRFMTMMIAHHAQAVAMAGHAAANGASAPVLALANRIVNGQQDEIATIEQWLRDRGQPLPAAAAHAHHAGDAPMHGMLTEAQLARLRDARGPEFDRLFLTFMIQHHRGAVAMVEELIATPGAAQDETVFKFASDVNVDQTTEIARMERMLLALMTGDPMP